MDQSDPRQILTEAETPEDDIDAFMGKLSDVYPALYAALLQLADNGATVLQAGCDILVEQLQAAFEQVAEDYHIYTCTCNKNNRRCECAGKRGE